MTTSIPARDLTVGDVFALHIYGAVIAVTSVADGRRVKIKIELENQGHRSYGNPCFGEGPSTLEFLDDHYVLEFLCRPGRKFSVYDDDDWDDSDGDDADAPTPLTPVIAE
jgi:hypothetical protein